MTVACHTIKAYAHRKVLGYLSIEIETYVVLIIIVILK